MDQEVEQEDENLLLDEINVNYIAETILNPSNDNKNNTNKQQADI